MIRSISVVFASVLTLVSVVPAFAQAAPPAPSPFVQMVPFIVIFAVMYFLMIRPQMKRQKQHQTFISQMKRGDEVLTASGILGRIEGMTEQFVTLEIAPDVRIKVLRNQVAGSAAAVTQKAPEVKA